jgi:hypothetical protein
VAAPGSEFHYFNPNYQLLASVVEAASGEPYSSYVEEHVLAPLQMAHSFSAITSAEAYRRAENLSDGYLQLFGGTIRTREMDGFLGGSGGIISSAEDMAHYLILYTNGGRFAEATLLSPSAIELMLTPPQALESNYGMGWFKTEQDGTTIFEHNGVLSVFYAEMVLLPETQEAFVLLYNVSSLASDSLAAPELKKGLIRLLRNQEPKRGGLSVRHFGWLIGICTIAGAALGIRSLLRLPRWAATFHALPLWRRLLGLLGTLLPALFLWALPSLITASSGRAFSYFQLSRSMPDIFVWLGVGTVLGVINGVARILLMLRRPRNSGEGSETLSATAKRG